MPKNILLLFIAFLFISGCTSKSEKQNSGPELKLVSDDFSYAFMNDAFLRDTTKDPRNWVKLKAEVIPQTQGMMDWIKSLDTILTKEDVTFMIAQLDTTQYSWDFKRLRNVVYLNDKMVDSLFSNETVNAASKDTVRKDAWELFRERYGNYGIQEFSKPIYNKDKTIVVIEQSGSGDWLLGSGNWLLMKKENGKWNIIQSSMLWIS